MIHQSDGALPAATDCNRCIAAIGPSVSNPILHTTDRWFSVPCNQVLHKTARFQGAAEHRVSNLRMQIAKFSFVTRRHVPVQKELRGDQARKNPRCKMHRGFLIRSGVLVLQGLSQVNLRTGCRRPCRCRRPPAQKHPSRRRHRHCRRCRRCRLPWASSRPRTGR